MVHASYSQTIADDLTKAGGTCIKVFYMKTGCLILVGERYVRHIHENFLHESRMFHTDMCVVFMKGLYYANNNQCNLLTYHICATWLTLEQGEQNMTETEELHSERCEERQAINASSMQTIE